MLSHSLWRLGPHLVQIESTLDLFSNDDCKPAVTRYFNVPASLVLTD